MPQLFYSILCCQPAYLCYSMLGPQRGLFNTHHAYTQPHSGAYYGMRILCYIVCSICLNNRMQVVVTLESDDPIMEDIFSYCQLHDIPMSPGRYIVLDGRYWIWRIEAEPSKHLFWLLLKYPEYLVTI